MSDYRVVAAVMATLQNMLQDAIGEAVPGAVVRTGPPEEEAADQVAEGMIKLFLFRVEPNPTWRNAELPVRASDGRVVRQPQMAVNLDLLFSFYGSEQRKVPYLLLGLTLAALHAEPYPSVRFMPRPAPAGGNGAPDPVSASLAGSGLDQQAHALRLSLLPLSHDELFPLFSHIPYVMSVAYRAQVVLIEPFATPQPALPVRRADVFLAPGPPPRLSRVEPPLLPYSDGAQVELVGEGLTAGRGAPPPRVLVDELPAEPSSVSDDRLRVALPEGTQAGMRLLRVVRSSGARLSSASAGSGADDAPPDLESNPVALAVEPVVRSARAALTTDGQAVELTVDMDPAVRAATPVSVLLNPVAGEAGGGAGTGSGATSMSGGVSRAYVFQANAEPTAPHRVDLVLPPDSRVRPGDYLLRVQVDGVTSRLSTGADGGFDGPRVTIPKVSAPPGPVPPGGGEEAS